MENSIELRGLRKYFGEKTALNGLTWTMEGGVFGVLGGAGAGKSTLLRALATLLPLDGGEARVCGLPLSKPGAVRALVGYLPDDFTIYGDLRAREVMDYLGALSGLDAPTRRARTAQLFERLGLAAEAETRVRRLSAGSLRRLGVAAGAHPRPARAAARRTDRRPRAQGTRPPALAAFRGRHRPPRGAGHPAAG